MRTAIAAALTALLAGCAAPAAWEKPGASEERRALDLAECASFARNEMRSHRAAARERTPEPDAASIGRNEDAAVQRRLREADAEDLRGELIASCMGAKGYSAARAGGRAA